MPAGAIAGVVIFGEKKKAFPELVELAWASPGVFERPEPADPVNRTWLAGGVRRVILDVEVGLVAINGNREEGHEVRGVIEDSALGKVAESETELDR